MGEACPGESAPSSLLCVPWLLSTPAVVVALRDSAFSASSAFASFRSHAAHAHADGAGGSPHVIGGIPPRR